MIVHTDRIVLVFPIPDKSRPAAASLQTLTVYDDGTERETVVPLDPERVKDYSEAFTLPLVLERDKLTTDLQAMTTEHVKQKAIADTVPGLQAQIATLQSEKTTLQTDVAALTAEKTQLTTDLAAVTAERDKLTADLETLTTTHTEQTTQLQSVTAKRDSLRTERDAARAEREALRAKVVEMEGHPDVLAARKAKRIAEAKAVLVAAEQAKAEAEAAKVVLVELGEPIEEV